jgi:hypothetical protein
MNYAAMQLAGARVSQTDPEARPTPMPIVATHTPSALLLAARNARAGLRAHAMLAPVDAELSAVSVMAVQASRAPDQAEILRNMQTAVRFMQELACITEPTASRLASIFETPPRAPTAEQRDIIAGFPALAAWHARREAQIAEAESRDADDRERARVEHEAAQAEAAAAERAAIVTGLVRRLAASGITLAATHKGITARPAELLTDGERVLIREHRDALLAVLQSVEVIA